MTPQEQAQKLATISILPSDELRGWWACIHRDWSRDPFPGEEAALEARAKALGITLK